MRQRYLRKINDTRPVIPVGDLFIWSEILSQRPDMVEIWGPPPAEANRLGGVQSPDGERFLPRILPVIDEEANPIPPVSETPSPGDQYRIALIVAAIAVMPLEEYTLPDPRTPAKPRVDRLRSVLGFDVSAVERDCAFEIFLEAKKERIEKGLS
ncbi:MAG: hypothetical protein HY282_16745 [Nitrospirae bacterium]|nr:hypothetical protein [Candidatus Manganitrophaceae bacterium]